MNAQKLTVTLGLLAFLMPLASQATPPPEGKLCVKRPLTDFLDTQGTLNNPPQFFAPVQDYVGWAGGDFVTFALVDYAGLANEYIKGEGAKSLSTQVNGTVWECKQADGTAKVAVKLVTANAMGFAQSIEELATNNFNFAGTPTIFGAKAVDVVSGAEAAKGTAFLDTTFTIAQPGAPLPDFLDVVYTSTYAPATLHFESNTIGRLPNGDRARLKVDQIAETDAGGNWVYSVETVEILVPGQ